MQNHSLPPPTLSLTSPSQKSNPHVILLHPSFFSFGTEQLGHVCLSICLSVYPVCLSVCLSVYLSTYLSVCILTNKSSYCIHHSFLLVLNSWDTSVCLSVNLPVCLYGLLVCLSVCQSVSMSVSLSVCLSVSLPTSHLITSSILFYWC